MMMMMLKERPFSTICYQLLLLVLSYTPDTVHWYMKLHVGSFRKILSTWTVVKNLHGSSAILVHLTGRSYKFGYKVMEAPNFRFQNFGYPENHDQNHMTEYEQHRQHMQFPWSHFRFPRFPHILYYLQQVTMVVLKDVISSFLLTRLWATRTKHKSAWASQWKPGGKGHRPRW